MKVHTILKLGLCLLAGAGLSVSVPASAQDGPTTYAPTSDWKVTKKVDRCRLTRAFGSGDNLTRVTFEKGGNEPTFNLTISGQAVANPIDNLISLRFGPEEKPIGRSYISAKTKSGRPVIMMYGADFSPAVTAGNGLYTTDRADDQRLSAIEYIEIERAGLKKFRMASGSMNASMKSLAECSASLTGTLRASRTGISQHLKAAGDVEDWVTSKDYPRLMLGYQQGGEIGFRLTVNETGKPTFCVITDATVPQMFDDSVCLALLKNARFEPALDLKGRPTQSYYSNAVRFFIE